MDYGILFKDILIFFVLEDIYVNVLDVVKFGRLFKGLLMKEILEK